MKADKTTDIDRGEKVSSLEPMLIGFESKHRAELGDLAVELAACSAGFRHSLAPQVTTALADLVRSMNCYYSNLIEGHDTHPIDIERALHDDYSMNSEKRNLQLEAKAHISVQQWIDTGGLGQQATTVAGLREIHRRFCELLPEDLLWVQELDGEQKTKLIPGQWRNCDVSVGHHVAISPGAVPRFLERFEKVYTGLGKSETLLAAAAAHHRLLWIHPFLDGNGRVARLMSYSLLQECLDTGGLWSIARGFARDQQAYKEALSACDRSWRNDLDGRGNLSEESLVSFTQFFLETCIDQVKFMESLMQVKRLRERILVWCEEEMRLGHLPAKANVVLESLLYRGELARGEMASILDTSDRQARRVVAALTHHSALTSLSPRAPLTLAFPATLAERWLPGLFPGK